MENMESKKNDRQGKKDTKGKVRMELLPMEALRSVAEILTFGAEKYGANNWQNIDDGYNLFWGALLRHKTLKDMGEEFDKESGKPHDAHIACNALFMLYYSLQKQKELNKLKTIDEMLFEAVADSLIRGFNNCIIQKTTDEKQKEVSDIVEITTDAIQGFAGVKEKGLEEERQKAIKDILNIYHSFVGKLFKTPINFDNENKD